MSMFIACQSCGARIRVPDEGTGKKVKCLKCGELLVVPASALPPQAPGGVLPVRIRWRAALEVCIQLFILYSVITHVVELELGQGKHSTGFFFWSELVVAGVFTVEYFVRWVASRRWRYPLTPLAIIDLLAILPFYFGFIIDLRFLRLIRTFRILRLFKLYRYSSALHNLVNAFLRIRHELGILAFALVVLALCSALAVYEMEYEAQPDKFGNLFDAGWYVLVTLTTVGYGDKVPVTVGGKLVAGGTMIAGLGVFATFISLMGSAFLEEIREAMQRQAAANRALPAMSPTDFDPQQVLQALDSGRLRRADGSATPEAVQLLMTACLALLLHLPAERSAAARADSTGSDPSPENEWDGVSLPRSG